MAGYITDEDRAFVEQWEHISPQQWGIIRLDPRGDERHEIISGRRNFKLTTEERIITQDKIRRKDNDPFLNGSFRPVVVPDSVTIETNPNALSDEELLAILGSSDLAWDENLKTITALATYKRMLDLAEDADITLRRFRQLEERIDAVRGEVRISTNDPALLRFLGNRPSTEQDGNLVASGTANPRRQGGRSSDYR